jgi:glycosyltransferase involved in cell wall biosynthesis
MKRPVFVVPDMEATISGGNLYNLGLTAALRAAGVPLVVLDDAAALAGLAAGARGPHFVDSLYLPAMPRLRAARGLRADAPLVLIAHYLPSLVERGVVEHPGQLSEVERAALAAADGFVVPSEYMARALARVGAQPRKIAVVAPGLDPAARAAKAAMSAAATAPAARTSDGVARALLVANLVAGKGVLPFLEAIAPHLDGGAPLQVSVVGSAAMEPAYAAACRAVAAAHPQSALVGPLAHAETLARLAASDLFVSPSRMESFGLALAEARALGVPILARAGGNSAAHVDPAAGGRLFGNDAALAAECARLARDPVELGARRAAAQAARSRSRSWADAARDLVTAATGRDWANP